MRKNRKPAASELVAAALQAHGEDITVDEVEECYGRGSWMMDILMQDPKFASLIEEMKAELMSSPLWEAIEQEAKKHGLKRKH